MLPWTTIGDGPHRLDCNTDVSQVLSRTMCNLRVVDSEKRKGRQHGRSASGPNCPLSRTEGSFGRVLLLTLVFDDLL